MSVWFSVRSFLWFTPSSMLTYTDAMLSKQMLNLVNASVVITHEAPEAHELAYMAREMVQATLPHSSPRGNPPEWYRTNGYYTLSIRPGYKTDPKTGERVCVGYPYGSIPRLLLFWITTEALRKESRKLELGDTLAEFMRKLDLDPSTGGGPRGDAARLRNQFERLFRATISFDYSVEGHTKWLDMQVAPKGELWWDPKTPDQTNLFGSWIELGEEFYQAITGHPVPVDIRALRALKQSPMALDLYAWLTFKSYAVMMANKPVRVPWHTLQFQVGAEYSNLKDFKRKAKAAIHKVQGVYPGLKLNEVDGGLVIGVGRPAIPLKPPKS